jgi:hypothetical protein
MALEAVRQRMNSWILAMPEWHRCEVEFPWFAACHGNPLILSKTNLPDSRDMHQRLRIKKCSPPYIVDLLHHTGWRKAPCQSLQQGK